MTPNTHSSKKHAPRAGVIAAALACALALASGPAFAEAVAEAVAKQVSGAVEIGRGEPPTWSVLATGDTIGASDRIRTGSDGRIEISMAAGTIRVHENSMLRLPPPEGDADQVRLDEGHSLFDVVKRAGRRFEVHTPTVVVSVKGTRFGVDARRPIGEVAVYRGLVGVRQAGVEGAMETLVREGFLAAGGPGVPFELDMAPGGDPWIGWQDSLYDPGDPIEAPARLDDLGRARESLRRSTDVDVIERAAERKPEVAERLDRLGRQKAEAAKKAVGPGGRALPVPAAPLLDGDAVDRKGERGRAIEKMLHKDDDSPGPEARREQLAKQLMEARLAERELAIEALLSTSGGSGTGEIELSFGQLNTQYGVGLVPTVVEAMEEVDSILTNAGGTYSVDDVLTQLESVLVTNGMDPTLATSIVTTLGNR